MQIYSTVTAMHLGSRGTFPPTAAPPETALPVCSGLPREISQLSSKTEPKSIFVTPSNLSNLTPTTLGVVYQSALSHASVQ